MENLQNNCPLGHGEMRNGSTTKEIDFRGERISYQLECLICPLCNLTRATVEQTTKAQNAIADAYRQKVGLLTGEEIRHRRVELGLSQQQLADKTRLSKMSIVRWENGVIQKESSDATLREILCPRDIENEYSGNRELSLGRIKQVYREFEKNLPYQLLIPGDKGLFAAKNCWYADLVAYRELGRSMTGATYAIMPYGPQLDNYADLVDEILKADVATVEPLSEKEIEIIQRLAKIFATQRAAYDASHEEPVWNEIKKDLGRHISYKVAYRLTAA